MAWQTFEDIDLWQTARVICGRIWLLIKRDSVKCDRGITYQMLNSSGSMMDNIAEGFARGSNQEFKTFLGYSKASSAELLSQLFRLKDRDCLTTEEFNDLRLELIVFGKKATGLIKRLNNGRRRGFRLDKD